MVKYWYSKTSQPDIQWNLPLTEDRQTGVPVASQLFIVLKTIYLNIEAAVSASLEISRREENNCSR